MRRTRITGALPKRKTKAIFSGVVEGLKKNPQLELFESAPTKTIWSNDVKSRTLREALIKASNIGVPDFEVKKGIGLVQSKRLAKNLAELFTYNELFDRRRSFAAKNEVFAKWKELRNGKQELVRFGIDSSIYSLLASGVSPKNTVTIVREILLIKPDVFYKSEVDRRNLGNVALDYSRRELIPKLRRMGVFPRAYHTNPNVQHRIEKGIDLIIYLGFKRELSSRKQDAFMKKRFPELSKEEKLKRHIERISSKRDVQELFARNTPMSVILDMYPYVEGKVRGKKKKPSKILRVLNEPFKKKKRQIKPTDNTRNLF